MHYQDPIKIGSASTNTFSSPDRSQTSYAPANVLPDLQIETTGTENSKSGRIPANMPVADVSDTGIPPAFDAHEVKQVIAPNMRCIEEYKEATSQRSCRYPRPWKTICTRAGPLSGVLSMLLAIASILACLGVLESSDGAAVSSWGIQPSEYLAVFTAIANLAMRYACIQGVVIAWWTRAHRGSTLSRLHWDWRSGTTLIGAVTGGRRLGWFGLACIFSTLVTVDGPLLQKATHVITAPIVGESVSLSVRLVPEIPRFYSGWWDTAQSLGLKLKWSQSFNNTIPTIHGSASNQVFAQDKSPLYDTVLQNYQLDAPLFGVMNGCQTSCKAKLIAPAFMPRCRLQQIAVDYSAPANLSEVMRLMNTFSAAPIRHDAFIIASSLVNDVVETLDLITAWSAVEHCRGILNYRVCTLSSAIGEYDVAVDHNEVRLDNPGHPRILAIANNTSVDPTDSQRSTLAVVAALMSQMFEASMAVYNISDDINTVAVGPVTAIRYVIQAKKEKCPSFADPYENMMAALNRFMVYLGAVATDETTEYLQEHLDPGWLVHTTTTGEVVGSHNVFKSEFRFFIAAALVELACILLVAPTYWGWWRLGRPCSFSPLEIAKAFESPLLADVNSNSSGRDLAKQVGEVRVRYGSTAQHGLSKKSKLAFANPMLVECPEKGATFDL